MKKIFNFIKVNKIKSIIGLGVILSLLVVFISFSLADPTPNYTFTYNSTGTNNNYSNNDPGSFSLIKRAEWVSHNRLKVTMSIDSKEFINSTGNDVLLVVDTSSFLDNNMLNDLKSSLTSAASYLRTKDSTSKIGIVEFNDSYTKYDFTNNLTTINSNINSLSIGNGRSYYKAFDGIDDILTNRDTTRGLRVVFITTGVSNLNKSGDPYKYELLNNKYHLNINCIYYLTNGVLDQPSNYFSREVVASTDTLEVNIEALGIDYKPYTNFTITDHYDTSKFSLVGNLSDYYGSDNYTNYGILSVTNAGEIQWVMEDGNSRPFYTGTTAKLEYELDYTGGTGNYSLNTTNILTSKTINQVLSNATVTDNIVIGNSYNVTYVANAPSGCSPSGSYGAIHKDVKQVVQFPSDPTCTGYKFAGWKVTTSGVNTSKNGFVMPEKNVEVKATWSKVSLTKDMKGDIRQSKPLYNVLKDEAESNGLAREYTGSHQDTMAGSGSSKIYYFYDSDANSSAILDKNNVIFADHCWQMLRTTDTGGIKMIYNGPVVNNKCSSVLTDTGETTATPYFKYNSPSSLSISGTVYFGTDYTYNSSTQEFSLAGTVTASTISSSMIGKYTCNSSSSSGTCSTLYLIINYVSSYNATVLGITPINTRYQNADIGKSPFNVSSQCMADVGYMTNLRYPAEEYEINYNSMRLAQTYSYSSNQYTLTGTIKKFDEGETFGAYHYWLDNSNLNTANYIMYIVLHVRRRVWYVQFTGGINQDSARTNMLDAANVNTNNSMLKTAIEKWYSHYLQSYTSKLENVIYCNDRTISSLGSWSPSSTNDTASLTFNNYTLNSDLSCSRNLDKFSVDNSSARLNYPIGISTSSEMNLIGNNNARATGSEYWLLSPSYFGRSGTSYNIADAVYSIDSSGAFSTSGTGAYRSVRPVISLVPGTTYSNGDGSMNHPYIVD